MFEDTFIYKATCNILQGAVAQTAANHTYKNSSSWWSHRCKQIYKYNGLLLYKNAMQLNLSTQDGATEVLSCL